MTPTDAPRVVTRLGSVVGLWTGGVARFTGIPFAQPPVGPLRFAAPVPVGAWDGDRLAVDFGATPQLVADRRALVPEPTVRGDDILNLNIWTPSPERDAKLPVIVYIHGGGYTTGSTASPWYDGTSFARDGVVLVSISYRLGFAGFGWIDGAVQNRGVLDWLCALEWVHNHIAEFGGDPSRVTVAGQSAGAGAVLTLMGMPETRGLIAGGWAMSPAVTDLTPSLARRFSGRMARILSVSPDVAGFSSATAREIVQAQPRARKARSFDPFVEIARALALGPTIDGDVLRENTFDALARASDIPLVIGAMHDEFVITPPERFARVAQAISRRALLATGRVPRRARRSYIAANPDAAEGGGIGIAARFASDLVFAGTVVHAASTVTPSWVYRFDWQAPKLGAATHCVDVPFFFDTLKAEGVEREFGTHPPDFLARAMHGAAVAFATHADPGWTAWSSANGSTRIFGGTSTMDSAGWARMLPLANAGVTPRSPALRNVQSQTRSTF